jgi:hypothetical protein
MMPTAKCRAWDEKRKIMMEIMAGIRPKGVRAKDFFVGFNSSGLEVSEYEGKGVWRIFPVMLWTGLPDAKGRPIYQSDIVIDEWDSYRWIVEFDNYARFVLKRIDSPYADWLQFDEFERQGKKGEFGLYVAGNVFENPELMALEMRPEAMEEDDEDEQIHRD